mmetsp:Transcript_1711/g.1954  ORF Transcript_1711/g.1954 Transcript_1711/m.1954 type:complete len:219 (-) Transcript_1711:74-730(-)
MVACAIRCASSLVNREKKDVSYKHNSKESEFDFSEAGNFNLDPSEFATSWAKRPTRGTRNGAGQIEFYEKDIRHVFQSSIREKILKAKAVEALEHLKNKYPHRYDIPSLSAIKYELSRMYSRSYKTTSRSAKLEPGEKKKKSRHGMQPRYAQFIEELLKAQPNLTGKPAAKLFMERFKDEDESDLPTMKQVQTKVNSLKQMLAKKDKETQVPEELNIF